MFSLRRWDLGTPPLRLDSPVYGFVPPFPQDPNSWGSGSEFGSRPLFPFLPLPVFFFSLPNLTPGVLSEGRTDRVGYGEFLVLPLGPGTGSDRRRPCLLCPETPPCRRYNLPRGGAGVGVL